jgi:hypothetical protein
MVSLPLRLQKQLFRLCIWPQMNPQRFQEVGMHGTFGRGTRRRESAVMCIRHFKLPQLDNLLGSCSVAVRRRPSGSCKIDRRLKKTDET